MRKLWAVATILGTITIAGPAARADTLLGAPYLWGNTGKTCFTPGGSTCSADAAFDKATGDLSADATVSPNMLDPYGGYGWGWASVESRFTLASPVPRLPVHVRLTVDSASASVGPIHSAARDVGASQQVMASAWMGVYLWRSTCGQSTEVVARPIVDNIATPAIDKPVTIEVDGYSVEPCATSDGWDKVNAGTLDVEVQLWTSAFLDGPTNPDTGPSSAHIHAVVDEIRIGDYTAPAPLTETAIYSGAAADHLCPYPVGHVGPSPFVTAREPGPCFALAPINSGVQLTLTDASGLPVPFSVTFMNRDGYGSDMRYENLNETVYCGSSPVLPPPQGAAYAHVWLFDRTAGYDHMPPACEGVNPTAGTVTATIT